MMGRLAVRKICRYVGCKKSTSAASESRRDEAAEIS
jgi:hypothetical protein